MVDWNQLIADLLDLPMTMTAISRAVGIPRTNLLHYRDAEGTPLHPEGELLVSHWCAVTGRARSQLPLRPRPTSAAKV